jgi:hypothetical protein
MATFLKADIKADFCSWFCPNGDFAFCFKDSISPCLGANSFTATGPVFTASGFLYSMSATIGSGLTPAG